MADKESRLHASVMWAQRKEKLYITINLEDVKDPKIEITETKLTFSGHGGTEKKDYHAELEFFKEIDPKESKYLVLARNIPFVIKKKEGEEEFWPRLLKEKTKMHWLKTDFNRWKDEDDSDVEEDAGDNDLDAMMQKMGGLGGMENPMGMMNNMGGMNPGDDHEQSSDSDDEDLPDLE